MFQAGPMPANTTVIVQHRGQGGVLAGILGCVFGLLGIFSWGLIFVPLAALCSVIGFVRGIVGRSPAGVGTSILAAMLCFWGFVFSPSLWALFAAGLIASHVPASSPNVAVTPRPAIMAPQVSPQSIPAPDPAGVARQRTAQQEREFAVQLDNIISRMERDDAILDNYIRMLPITEQNYSAITTQMQRYLERERELAGNPKASVARSQISVAMGQGPIKTERLHNQVQPAQWNFENSGAPLMQQIISHQNACDGFRKKISDKPVDPAAHTLETACARLQNAAMAFKPRYDALSQDFTRAEATYQRERQAQEQLVTEAFQLQ